MKLIINNRELVAGESVHIYGNDSDGFWVCLTREGMSGSHPVWPHVFGTTKATIKECELYISHKGWSDNYGNCSCCEKILLVNEG